MNAMPSGLNETVIKTNLLTAEWKQKPCTLTIRPAELVITSKGIPDIHIAMEQISALMFKDESVPDKAMAGFGIDYKDRGPARLMFFNDGWFPVSKTRKAVEAIQAAHYHWSKGELAPLNVIDVSALEKKAASSVIHRNI
jgi:hypothetical protein